MKVFMMSSFYSKFFLFFLNFLGLASLSLALIPEETLKINLKKESVKKLEDEAVSLKKEVSRIKETIENLKKEIKNFNKSGLKIPLIEGHEQKKTEKKPQ